jgi:hypothetical protein
MSAATLRQIAAASVAANIVSHIWRSFTRRQEHYWSLGHRHLIDRYRPVLRSAYALSKPVSMKFNKWQGACLQSPLVINLMTANTLGLAMPLRLQVPPTK